MKEKSVLTKLTELAMFCQGKKHAKELQMLDNLQNIPEMKELREKLIYENKIFMDDCRAVLKAEKLYLQMQSN